MPHLAYHLKTNSSEYVTGPVLSQLDDDEKWHHAGFYSKGLNDVERDHPEHDKDMLSVIRGLQEWRHPLEGAKHKFKILNDHHKLLYLTTQNLNCQQARWSLYLSCFDI